MKYAPWIAAAVSAPLLILTVARFDLTARGPAWTRADAESRLRATAKQQQAGEIAWPIHATARLDPDRLQSAPLTYRVRAKGPKKSYLQADYSPEGALLRWECRGCPKGAAEDWSAHLPSDPAPPLKDVAAAFRSTGEAIVVLLQVAGGLILLFRLRRGIRQRRMVLAIIGFWTAMFLIGKLFEPNQDSISGNRLGAWLLTLCSGLMLIRAQQVRRWVGLLQLAERWRPSTESGRELRDGLLLGWPLALCPYIAGHWGDPVWLALSPSIAFETLPAAMGLVRQTNLIQVQIPFFALAAPLFAGVRPAWGRYTISTLVGIVLFSAVGNFKPLHPFDGVSTGILLLAGSAWIYRSCGLLGLIASWIGSALATPIAWMAAVRPGAISNSALVYGIFLAAAIWLSSRKGGEPTEELTAEIERRNSPETAVEDLGERAALRAEFAEAAGAQKGMLPERAPEIPGFSIAATCRPAKDVGGDLYDFLEFPDGGWGIVVADVSGKGVPAALYMTMTKGLLASAQRSAVGLDDLAATLNEPLYEAGRRKTFVTLAMARLDVATKQVELIRAGHNPILWRRAALGETVYLQPGGLALGMVSNKMFTKKLDRQTIQMEPGDLLLLYSDGLTETENTAQDLYGEDRLRELAEQSPATDAASFLNEVLESVAAFQGAADQHDDLTLVVLKLQN